MENVNIEEAVANAVPIAIKVKMTRAEKLTRWADLVRNYGGGDLMLYHKLEYWPEFALRDARFLAEHGWSAFGLAVHDETFRAQGLPSQANLVDIMQFFDIDQIQLHEFSCDCGGVISNELQAKQIGDLVNRPRTIGGFIRRIGAAIC